MPPISQSDCIVDALLWPLAGYGDDGLPYVLAGSAEEVKVAWTQQLRTGTDPKGNVVTTTVTMAALRIVDGVPARVPLGSFVWLGTLNEVSGTASEPVPDGRQDLLWQVVTENTALDVRGRSQRFEYGLTRFSGVLPIGP